MTAQQTRVRLPKCKVQSGAESVTSGDHAPISMVCPREQGHIIISLLFYKAVVPTQAGITGVSSSGKDMGL